MKITIFGAGGIGGYFGGRLAKAGADVTFIARGQHKNAIERDGLRVESINGDFVVPVIVTDNPQQVSGVDLVIVAVKAWQLEAAAKSIEPMMGDNTTVLPLQNGVEATTILSAELGASHVLGGLCKIMSSIKEPGLIHHEGAEPTVILGELDGTNSHRVDVIVDLFEKAGVATKKSLNIDSEIWKKFLFIASWSGLGAVTRSSVGRIRSSEGSRALMIQAMTEIHSVATAAGIHLPDTIVSRTMSFVDSLPESGITSMQRDIQHHRPSELESQNGAVIRLGAKFGVATPVNTFIYHSLSLMETRARSKKVSR